MARNEPTHAEQTPIDLHTPWFPPPSRVRVGPFAHGECRNGGLPDWLYGRPFAVRSTDPRFLAHVRPLYAQIAAQVEGMLFKDDGRDP